MKKAHPRIPRIVATLVSLLTVMLSLSFAAPALAAGKAPAASAAQKAGAIVKPSVVFIQTQWHGWLMSGPLADLLSPDGTSAPGFTVTTTCTGFVANPQGYVVTAGHCVDNQSMQYGGKGLIVQAAVARAVHDGYLDAGQAAAAVREGYQSWRVEGTEAGSPPDRTVGIFPTEAASGIKTTTPMVATVVGVVPFLQGDVALLKVQSDTPMPAVQVAPAAPQEGEQVVALGYPGSVSESVDFNVSEPSATTGEVSGNQTVGGVPFTEITAATSPGMSGGPVIDMQGRVVGTVSWQPGSETQSFNFITDTQAIRSLLASQAVGNTLSTADQLYRTGLSDYFAGRYHAAATAFGKVLQLEPNHAMAQEYERLAVTNYPNEVVPPKKAGSSHVLLYLLVGVGAAVVLLAGGGTALLVRRRRRAGPGGAGGGLVAPAPGVTAPAGVMPPPPVPVPVPVTPPASTAPPAGEPPAVEGTAPAATSDFCSHCGQRHEPDALFCPSCGQRLPQMAGRASTNGAARS